MPPLAVRLVRRTSVFADCSATASLSRELFVASNGGRVSLLLLVVVLGIATLLLRPLLPSDDVRTGSNASPTPRSLRLEFMREA